MSERGPGWIQTFTGRQFWPGLPMARDVDILDIAHALSNTCRFAGHCRTFYSVAEHSVRLAETLAPEEQLWGLLHDAAEAYVLDLPRPIKHDQRMREYRWMERNVDQAIRIKFRLFGDPPPSVKVADNRMLFTEKRDLIAISTHEDWDDPYPPFG